ncbi:MAG: hypothetical protein J6V88_00610 [Kiritimatiellae bacterium]|jgi:hypothetical protein|nr:hypothetical protein [Kiritimatiellia bacterium]
MSAMFKFMTIKRTNGFLNMQDPWEMESNIDKTVSVRAPDGHDFGWRFFHYLTGGSIIRIKKVDKKSRIIKRQKTFIAISVVLAVSWLVFFFV